MNPSTVFNKCSTIILFCVSVIVFSFLVGIFSPSPLYGKPFEIAIFIPREDPFWNKTILIDGIIFVAYQNTAEQILRIAEKNSIPAILINSQLSQADLLPRTKYKYWIGSLLPDNEKAGSVLIKQLINEARKNGMKRLNVLAIEGNPKDESSIDRIRGLRSFIGKEGVKSALDSYKVQMMFF